MKGLLAYAFSEMGLAKVTGSIVVGNETSRRMCTAAGFAIDGAPQVRDYHGKQQLMWIIYADAPERRSLASFPPQHQR
jgi:RimJ/RimL family protein N-acetyltransferase